MENENYKILIVDDTAKNIQILGNVLRNENYDIYFANSGKAALMQIEYNDFDLILLDVMMPEIDGFEVCSMLKGDDKTKDIPIIFLTAKNDQESIIEGFKRGAQDYITKPFEPLELLMRVKTQINLKIARDELKKKNQKMKEELAFAKRIHSKIVTFNTPELNQYYVKADNISVGGIGGDFIECIKLDNGMIGIAFVDVSGHGISAALMVSALKFIINTSFKNIYSPSEAMYYLNDIINNTFLGNDVTLSINYMIINDINGKITISNCSQEDPVIIKKDSVISLKEKGIILGVLDNDSIKGNEEISFKDIELDLESGEKIFFYTDGLVEADVLTRSGLNEFLMANREKSYKGILESIKNEFRNKLMHEERDDSTYMIIEKK